MTNKSNFSKMFAEYLDNPVLAGASDWCSVFWDAYDEAANYADYNHIDNLPVLAGAAKMIGAMLASTRGLECAKTGESLADWSPVDVLTKLGTIMIAEYHRQVEIIGDE